MVLFPRVNALVINSDVLTGLSDSQQDVLRNAATATRDWAVETNADDAKTFCDYNGAIVLAEDSDIASIREATQPVHDELEQDEATAAMIDRISELGQDVPPAVEPAACS